MNQYNILGLRKISNDTISLWLFLTLKSATTFLMRYKIRVFVEHIDRYFVPAIFSNADQMHKGIKSLDAKAADSWYKAK